MDAERYSIEIESEVRLWLESIPAHYYTQAEVDRAHAAQRLCEAEHRAAAERDLHSRDLKENR